MDVGDFGCCCHFCAAGCKDELSLSCPATSLILIPDRRYPLFSFQVNYRFTISPGMQEKWQIRADSRETLIYTA
jgi:hypothetical protein